MLVYVLNKDSKPLMPCSARKAKVLLKESKAKVIRRTPFTIKLLYGSSGYKQEVVAGMDAGSKVIGTACVSNGKVLYKAETFIRQDVSNKMQQRKMFRKHRRYRLRYREARFLNRASSFRKDRLPPSILSKVNSHLREKKFIESILPVSKWILELASFDIHKISNPEVKDYQEGQQKGFYNIKAFILDRDGYTCQHCKSKNEKLHVHHILFKSSKGTDSPENLITLCEKCHKDLHNGLFEIKGLKSKTKHAAHMNIIQSQLKKKFGDFVETFGYETKFKREQILNLPKTHYNDAIAICCDNEKTIEDNNIIIYRKHIAKGDYKQTRGKHSEIKIPTGKLFGFRKFDKVKTPEGVRFIKGKRKTGFFILMDIFGNSFKKQGNAKKNMIRISARKSVLVEVISNAKKN